MSEVIKLNWALFSSIKYVESQIPIPVSTSFISINLSPYVLLVGCLFVCLLLRAFIIKGDWFKLQMQLQQKGEEKDRLLPHFLEILIIRWNFSHTYSASKKQNIKGVRGLLVRNGCTIHLRIRQRLFCICNFLLTTDIYTYVYVWGGGGTITLYAIILAYIAIHYIPVEYA